MNSGMRGYIDIYSFDDKPRSRRRHPKAPSQPSEASGVCPLSFTTPSVLEKGRARPTGIFHICLSKVAPLCVEFILNHGMVTVYTSR